MPSLTTTAQSLTLLCSIPLTLAFTAFIILHRRYKKKLQAEDLEDAEKYKSLDFGSDLRYGGNGKGRKGKKGDPEMTAMGGQTSTRNLRGLSLDDPSPYLFPNARNSQESLASITRSVRDADHRYQLHAFGTKADDMSIRSPSALARRGTESTDGADAHLVGHAQAFGKSAPPTGNMLAVSGYPSIQEPEKAMLANQGGLAPTQPESRESFIDHKAFRKSNNYLGSFINSREPSMIEEEKAAAPRLTHMDSSTSTLVGPLESDSSPMISITQPYPDQTTTAAPRHSPAEKAHPIDPRDNVHSMAGSIYDDNANSFMQPSKTSSFMSDGDSFMYGDAPMKVTPPSPRDSASTHTVPARGQSLAAPLAEIHEQRESMYLGEGLDNYNHDNQRLSVLMRPLPHEDPTENPEERANRIRSFYKEYFDDSKGVQGQAGAPRPMPQPAAHTDYYEDYDTEYLNNAYTVYDTEQQGFVVGGAPFAQPITRRAMTPPPRAPPRNFRSRASSQASQSHYGGRGPPRGQSSMSNFHTQGPYSQGPGSERGRPQKRVMPPAPTPLTSLKTPHLLKDDSALYTTLDLAPPPTYRDMQAGRRPDSPLGVERPYSPVVRAYTPLQGAFEELSPMPSP